MPTPDLSPDRLETLIQQALHGTLPPVQRSESHWYLTVVDQGCVLCCKAEDQRIRMPGERPSDPRDRYVDSPRGQWACTEHFL